MSVTTAAPFFLVTRASDTRPGFFALLAATPARIRELRNYRELIAQFVRRDLKVQYHGSVIGFFWSLLNPILLITVYSFAFHLVLRVKVENATIFFTTGVLVWNYWGACASASTGSLIDQAGLIRKMYFPREVLPISTVLSQAVQFVLSFLVLVPALGLLHVPYSFALLAIVPFVLLQTVFSIGVAMALSALTVPFRDVRHLTGVFLMITFWLTPVVYPATALPAEWQPVLALNPMAVFLTGYRSVVIEGVWPAGGIWVGAILWTVAALAAGYIIFLRFDRMVPERV